MKRLLLVMLTGLLWFGFSNEAEAGSFETTRVTISDSVTAVVSTDLSTTCLELRLLPLPTNTGVIWYAQGVTTGVELTGRPLYPTNFTNPVVYKGFRRSTVEGLGSFFNSQNIYARAISSGTVGDDNSNVLIMECIE